MKRIALIPAYKPDETLKQLVSELVASDYSVVIVDDGSGEEYRFLFDNLRKKAIVLFYDDNRGKGYALKTGLKYIYENETDPEAVVVTMDADGQHLVSDAEKIYDELQKKEADMVIGSRVISKEAPIKSRYGNKVTRLVYRVVTKVNVYDTQSGLRAFSYHMIPMMLEIPGERYEYEMNVLLFMAKYKRRMTEVPIRTIYFDKQNSVSHFDAVKDSFKIYKEILKFSGSSLISFFIDYFMYLFILMLRGNEAVLLANICARMVSSCLNFLVNKKLVFTSDGNIVTEAVKYFGLVVMILSINTSVLTFLTSHGMNAFLCKIFVEFMLFLFSYGIQCFVIFRKRRE